MIKCYECHNIQSNFGYFWKYFSLGGIHQRSKNKTFHFEKILQLRDNTYFILLLIHNKDDFVF